MLTEPEAQTIMNEFVRLREEVKLNSEDTALKLAFHRQEKLCLDKFGYIVHMHTSHYRNFSNYEDLCQEGFMSLSRALYSYNPKKKASPFWWIHKYVGTTIARQSSQHSVIRYPIHVAKVTPPRREATMPPMIEQNDIPDLNAERTEVATLIANSLHILDANQQHVLGLVYGLNGEKPISISKVCQQLSLPRSQIKKILRDSLVSLKDVIKL